MSRAVLYSTFASLNKACLRQGNHHVRHLVTAEAKFRERLSYSAKGPSHNLDRALQRIRASLNSLPPARCGIDQEETDQKYMTLALENAQQAFNSGEIPVGAVLVYNGDIIAQTQNAAEISGDPTRHAEMTAIQESVQKIGRFKLPESTLYVTLEPCPMCAGAILQARVGTVVYAAKNPLLGADGSWISLLRTGANTGLESHPFHPNLKVRSGLLSEESSSLLKRFFQKRRQQISRKLKADSLS